MTVDNVQLARELFTVVTPTAAAHVICELDGPAAEGAMKPGSFTAALIATMTLADPWNMGKLSLGFPDYAAAVRLYLEVEGGRGMLYFALDSVAARLKPEAGL